MISTSTWLPLLTSFVRSAIWRNKTLFLPMVEFHSLNRAILLWTRTQLIWFRLPSISSNEFPWTSKATRPFLKCCLNSTNDRSGRDGTCGLLQRFPHSSTSSSNRTHLKLNHHLGFRLTHNLDGLGKKISHLDASLHVLSWPSQRTFIWTKIGRTCCWSLAPPPTWDTVLVKLGSDWPSPGTADSSLGFSIVVKRSTEVCQTNAFKSTSSSWNLMEKRDVSYNVNIFQGLWRRVRSFPQDFLSHICNSFSLYSFSPIIPPSNNESHHCFFRIKRVSFLCLFLYIFGSTLLFSPKGFLCHQNPQLLWEFFPLFWNSDLLVANCLFRCKFLFSTSLTWMGKKFVESHE